MGMIRKKRVFVSSTVYGLEELLQRIYSLLLTLGYEPWISHKGTLYSPSSHDTTENCRIAVNECDLFLGIITQDYGSGVERGEMSITHREMRDAIREDKPRWFLVHEHVTFMRNYLESMGFVGPGGVDEFQSLIGHDRASRGAEVFNLETVRLYDEIYKDFGGKHPIPYAERRGKWIQKMSAEEDALLYVGTQFTRYATIYGASGNAKACAEFRRYQEAEDFVRKMMEAEA